MLLKKNILQAQSDILGVTTNAAGRVAVTSSTLQQPAVFGMFAHWLEDNMPFMFAQPLPFTTITMTHGHLAMQKSGVARMDIVGSEFALATQDERTSEREVPLRLGICYFVVVGRHNIRPCWDIA